MYQGLDVVCFSPLKLSYARFRETLLRETGQAVTKENFLAVYGAAHLEVLQPELIKEAFRKTGIYPFCRDLVTPDMMAPSRETSYKTFLPIIPSTPVRIMTDLLLDTIQPEFKSVDQSPSKDSRLLPISPSRPARVAVSELAATDVGYLASHSVVKSSSEPPDIATNTISPIKKRTPRNSPELLEIPTRPNTTERRLQDALIAKQSEVDYWKSRAVELQSTMVLQRLYCGRVRRQLLAKEQKASKSKKKGGKLMGDGLGRILTEDEFYQRVQEHSAAQEEEEIDKEARKQARETRAAEIVLWEIEKGEIQCRNDMQKVDLKAALVDWEGEKHYALDAGERLKVWLLDNPKPKQSDEEFMLEKVPPKPKLTKVMIEVPLEEEEEDPWTDDDGADDGESE